MSCLLTGVILARRQQQQQILWDVVVLFVCFLAVLDTVHCLAAAANTVNNVSPATCKETSSPCFVGFDFGTSGARISVIEEQQESTSTFSTLTEIYSNAVLWSDADGRKYDDPKAWMNAATNLLQGAVDYLNQRHSHDQASAVVKSICVSGTSASCLMIDCKNAGKVTRKPRMYNDNVLLDSSAGGAPSGKSRDNNDTNTISIHGLRAMQLLEQYAPPRHTTRSPTSTLAKLLAWNEEQPLSPSERLCHQSDYIAMQFMSERRECGAASPQNCRMVASDWQNCLKLGYDVQNLQWPAWLRECLHQGIHMDDPARVLPDRVVSPGESIGHISSQWAQQTGLSENTIVVGGTTDSNAAFFAAAYDGGTCSLSWQPGTAVTSLGSTLAIKQLSHNYVEDATVGVYSHRFPSVLLKTPNQNSMENAKDAKADESVAWLVGGASNVGCAILRKLSFSNHELEELSHQIDPNDESPFSYYPLTQRGERFPVADSNKEPLLEPVPPQRKAFLHGILQSISTVECQGFLALAERGADLPRMVFTAGGGSHNDMWSRMRQRRLREAFARKSGSANQVVVKSAPNSEASFGAAILAAAQQIYRPEAS